MTETQTSYAVTAGELRQFIEPVPVSQLFLLLRYSPETGEFSWRTRSVSSFSPTGRGGQAGTAARWNGKYAGKPAFSADVQGYRHGRVNGVLVRAHRVAWAMHYGEWPNGQVDHINGDRSDNRIANLRVVDAHGNARNAKLRSDNSTGVSGVYKNAHGSWVAQIGSGPNRKYLGSFGSIRQASIARKTALSTAEYHQNHGRVS
jgi:hypothetical protein